MKLAVLALAALALAGCESTQSKSAKLERVAQRSKHEKGLVVSEQEYTTAAPRETWRTSQSAFLSVFCATGPAGQLGPKDPSAAGVVASMMEHRQ